MQIYVKAFSLFITEGDDCIVINYFVFHYVTDDGIVLIKQEEAGKPFITMLIGVLATNFLFTSIFVSIKGKIYGD